MLIMFAAMLIGFSSVRILLAGLPYVEPNRPPASADWKTQLIKQLPERMSGLTDILDAVPDDKRDAIIAAATCAQMHLEVRGAPFPNIVDQGEPDAEQVGREVEALLTTPTAVIAADRYLQHDPQYPRSGGEQSSASTRRAAMFPPGTSW